MCISVYPICIAFLFFYQWGIVFIGSLVFVLCVEAWKFGKRVYFRRSAARPVHTEVA